MARTYSSTPVLSKVKIGNGYYYLKDADVRGILDGINDGVMSSLQLALGTVDAGGNNLVTAANIKSYVDSAVAVGLVVEVVEQLPQASAEEMGKIFLVAQQGGKQNDAYDEYIVVRGGQEGAYTYSWEKIGDTRIDLSGYVSDVQYDAQSHTLKQQKGGTGAYANIHEFGGMADADTASVTVADYVTGLNFSGGSKAADSFTANVPTAIDVTKFSGGSFSEGEFTPASLGTGFYSAGSAAQFTEGQFTPASLGTGFAVAGSAAQFTEGAFTAATLTKTDKNVAAEGIVAAVGTGDDAECLIFTAAQTAAVSEVTAFSGGSKAADTFVANVPTAIDVSKFNGGSKAADSFTANVPAAIDVSKFNGGSKAADTFTAANLANGFYTAGQAAAFTEGAFTAATATLEKGSKKITVSPDAE